MGTRAEPVVGQQSTDARRPVVAARRPRREFISYGIATGPVATAIGALVAERWEGTARIVVWSAVTTILALSAIFLAEPGLIILSRVFRATRNQ